MWVWKRRSLAFASKSPHIEALGQKRCEQPQRRSGVCPLCILLRESKGEDAHPAAKSEIQSLPYLWRPDQPTQINSLS